MPAEDKSITISTTFYESELRELDEIRDSLPTGQQTRPGAIRALMQFWRDGHPKKRKTKERTKP